MVGLETTVASCPVNQIFATIAGLASHRKVITVVEQYGHWIVPAVFMVIGAAIVGESGVLDDVADLL